MIILVAGLRQTTIAIMIAITASRGGHTIVVADTLSGDSKNG